MLSTIQPSRLLFSHLPCPCPVPLIRCLLSANFPPPFSLCFFHHFPIAVTMASILGSQGVVLATAMAVSGTVILLALRLQKSLPASAHQFPVTGQIDPRSSQHALRSCISSGIMFLTASSSPTFPSFHFLSGDSFFWGTLLLDCAKFLPGVRGNCVASTDGKRRSEKKKKKKKKRVHFAEDVVDPVGYSEEFKRKHGMIISSRTHNVSIEHDSSISSSPTSTASSASNTSPTFKKISDRVSRMPANRMALYNGILRDRVVHRLACSYWSAPSFLLCIQKIAKKLSLDRVKCTIAKWLMILKGIGRRKGSKSRDRSSRWKSNLYPLIFRVSKTQQGQKPFPCVICSFFFLVVSVFL